MLEAETLRITGKSIDLSEMWFARMSALDKAERFVRLHGFARFDEGGLSHDVTEVFRLHGALPTSAMTGLREACTTHDHAALWTDLKTVLAPIASPAGKPTPNWRADVLARIDRHLGVAPGGPARGSEGLRAVARNRRRRLRRSHERRDAAVRRRA
jgi:bleomycin hydrolase